MDIPGISQALAAAAADAAPSSATDVVTFPHEASLTDIVAFQDSLELAATRVGAAGDSVSDVANVVLQPLDFINREAASLAEYARSAVESQSTLSAGEIVSLTVRSQEFMFHSQLTANIANRTADGIQQLFRQQS